MTARVASAFADVHDQRGGRPASVLPDVLVNGALQHSGELDVAQHDLMHAADV